MTSFRYQCSTDETIRLGTGAATKALKLTNFVLLKKEGRKKRGEEFYLFELFHPSDGFSKLQATILLSLG